MNEKHPILNYLYKEMVNKETLKYICIGLGFSTAIGSTLYISNIGLAIILKAYGIPMSSTVLNYITAYTGTHIVRKTLKSMVKGEYSIGKQVG